MNRLIKRKLGNNRKNNRCFFKFLIFLLLCFVGFFSVIIFNIDVKKFKILNKVEAIRNYMTKKSFQEYVDTRIIIDNQLNINVSSQIEKDILDFENFDNHNGVSSYIVPNIVHLIFFKVKKISFYQLINIYSIYLNHKPDFIYVHCDGECSFNDIYWDQILKIKSLKNMIKFMSFDLKKTIFGRQLKNDEQRLEIMKLLILMHYGGIYLDSNVYVVKSLNDYRRFEMSVSLEITPNERDRISTQVMISHKNARFLKAWYDSYRTRFSEILFYSSGTIAGKIFKKSPDLVHIERRNLGTANIGYELYKTYWSEWKTFNTLNLYLNQNYQETEIPFAKSFQEEYLSSASNCTFTYCEMCREVLKQIKPELN